ncbi:MAG: hypothetical protein Q4P36_04895 [Bowdeniella nasicola]|nr:hypothetical protein [Bowdeniella nasicola]
MREQKYGGNASAWPRLGAPVDGALLAKGASIMWTQDQLKAIFEVPSDAEVDRGLLQSGDLIRAGFMARSAFQKEACALRAGAFQDLAARHIWSQRDRITPEVEAVGEKNQDAGILK